MIFFHPHHEIKSKHHAKVLAATSFLVLLVYKLWKVIIRWVFHLVPKTDYFSYELHTTYYRIFGTLVGIYLIVWGYHNFKKQLKIGNVALLLGILAVFVPGDFLVRAHSLGYSLNADHFNQDLLFNFFAGIFTELMFRGCLFAALAYFMGIGRAALLSSFLFAFWHLDVTPAINPLMASFLFGLLVSYCYYLGASLLSLSLCHFIWDQVRFGVRWGLPESAAIDVNLSLSIFYFFVVAFIFGLSRRLEKHRVWPA